MGDEVLLIFSFSIRRRFDKVEEKLYETQIALGRSRQKVSHLTCSSYDNAIYRIKPNLTCFRHHEYTLHFCHFFVVRETT